jgi:hypothetical protein
MLHRAVRAVLLGLGIAILTAPGCTKRPRTTDPDLAAASRAADLQALSDALEAKIDDERDTDKDRSFAFHRAKEMADDGSAAWAFARAAIVGRQTEALGVKALFMVKEVEEFAMLAVARDPNYRSGAARRMLATLYVLAGDHVEHGDSELGLEMLEELFDEAPEVLENRLALAEGYVFLGDPDPALEHLCAIRSAQDQLRPAYRRQLADLFVDVGGVSVAGCDS